MLPYNPNFYQHCGCGDPNTAADRFSRYRFPNPPQYIPQYSQIPFLPLHPISEWIQKVNQHQEQQPTEAPEVLISDEDYRRIQKGNAEIRSSPKYSHINYLNVPIESSFPKYNIFPGFNFAIPQRPHNVYEAREYKERFDFTEMRQELEANGVSPLRNNLQIGTQFIGSDFPPLPSQSIMSKEGHLEIEVSQMNFNCPNVDHATINQLKLKLPQKPLEDFCIFCKNNDEDEKVYNSHTIRDKKGRVLCPRLRCLVCPKCGADGDNAHTLNHCPHKKIVSEADIKSTKSSFSLTPRKKSRSSSNRKHSLARLFNRK